MIDFEQGIVSRGNWSAIQSCMRRSAAGKPLTVAFLGGSITQGSLATTPENCYAYRVYHWWKKTFPLSQISYINAGIGGTTSQFGAARVDEDILRHHPDFVLTEFSVNDSNTPHFRETYEGLIRRILRSGAALMLMNNVCYDSGDSAEEMHLQVAAHYGLPSVSMKPTLYASLCAGVLRSREITPDDLHPNDYGHRLVAEGICCLLDKIHRAPWEAPLDQELPPPLTQNRYEDSRRYQSHNAAPLCEGFVPDETSQTHITECFRRGFYAWKEGDRITFSLKGKCISVQYRKSVAQPTPVAKITVDGAHSLILDGNFRETWGDCLYLDTVAEDLDPGMHQVTVEITQAHENDVVPFYLVSVIASEEGSYV